MSSPETRDKTNDYAYFTVGVLFVLIGMQFVFDRAMSGQFRLFTGSCLVAGVVMLVTSPKYMWRFSSVCISIMSFGGLMALYGVLVFLTGESGGPASQHISHSSGIYPLIAGGIIAMIGFVFRVIYSVFHP